MKIAGRDLDDLLTRQSLYQLWLMAVLCRADAQLSINIEAPGEHETSWSHCQRMLPSTGYLLDLDLVEQSADKLGAAHLIQCI